MDNVIVKAKTRSKSGKGEARRLRASGGIPCILYGKSMDNIKLSVELKDLEKLVQTGGAGSLISLKVEGEKDYPVMIRDVQKNPMGKYTHVDFYQVSLKDKLVTETYVYLTGEPKGAKEGGILQQPLRTVEVECLPTAIPESFEIDVSELEMGDSITVEKITPPEGVEIITDKDETIATVTYPQTETEEEEEAEVEEEAEEEKDEE